MNRIIFWYSWIWLLFIDHACKPLLTDFMKTETNVIETFL
jgi:hypothetical protein